MKSTVPAPYVSLSLRLQVHSLLRSDLAQGSQTDPTVKDFDSRRDELAGDLMREVLAAYVLNCVNGSEDVEMADEKVDEERGPSETLTIPTMDRAEVEGQQSQSHAQIVE